MPVVETALNWQVVPTVMVVAASDGTAAAITAPPARATGASASLNERLMNFLQEELKIPQGQGRHRPAYPDKAASNRNPDDGSLGINGCRVNTNG
jgi:hypothetical protein